MSGPRVLQPCPRPRWADRRRELETAKLFKNNEDLTVLRVAYTTDGVNFSTSGLPTTGSSVTV